MNGVTGRLAVLVVLGPAAIAGAQASDIDCKSATGGGPVRCEDPQGNGMRCTLATGAGPRNKHLLCQNEQLSARYERLYAEQQRLLHAGAVNDADISAWRAKRDTCGSERCLDSLFHEWWRWRETARTRPARAAAAPATMAAATVPARQAPGAPVADRAIPAQPVAAHPGAQANQQPVTQPATPAPPETTTFQAPPAEAASGLSPREAAPGGVGAPGLLAGFAALGIGTAYLWRRAHGRRAPAGRARRRALSAGMMILYGLLIVNVLLLAFALGPGRHL